MNILIAYPNLPLMFSPSMSIGIFTAIAKQENCNVDIFETTYYSSDFRNRHVTMTNIGANNGTYADEIFEIRDPDAVIPDWITKVDTFKPDLVLLSVTEDTYKLGVSLLEAIKEKNIPNIVGGVFARDGKKFLLEYDVVGYQFF